MGTDNTAERKPGDAMAAIINNKGGGQSKQLKFVFLLGILVIFYIASVKLFVSTDKTKDRRLDPGLRGAKVDRKGTMLSIIAEGKQMNKDMKLAKLRAQKDKEQQQQQAPPPPSQAAAAVTMGLPDEENEEAD